MSARTRKTKRYKKVLTSNGGKQTEAHIVQPHSPELFPGFHTLPETVQKFLRGLVCRVTALEIEVMDQRKALNDEHLKRMDQARHLRKEFRDNNNGLRQEITISSNECAQANANYMYTNARISILEDKNDIQITEDGTWIEWHGGECPLKSNDFVTIQLASGKCISSNASAFDWQYRPLDGRIIAYRPLRIRHKYPCHDNGRINALEGRLGKAAAQDHMALDGDL